MKTTGKYKCFYIKAMNGVCYKKNYEYETIT